jgi:polyisoprenyl-teichoic acid--peptidoglycan teichoic acid transferase
MSSGGGTRRRSPGTAAFLSFLWPGLGQWYAGARRTAIVFGVPVVVVVGVIASWMLSGPENVVIQLLTPGTALTIVVLIVLLGIWRILSMADVVSSLGGRTVWRRRRLAAGFGAMVVIVLASHAAMADVAWSFYQAGSRIFTTDVDPGTTPAPVASDNVVIMPVATPNETPVTTVSRINVLVLGIDSNEHRDHALTDTLLVVSVDPTTKTAAMVSFPRDIADFPMYSGGVYHGKINALMTDATVHPKQFPDGGITTLTKELGFLLGIPIHYYAAVNLDGFEAMIDPTYGGWKQPGRIGFHLTPGTYTFNGETALAYVRSRKGVGNNDFERARRQQQLLVALEHKLSDPAMLPKLPAILDAVSKTITTSFPADRLSDMLALARSIDDASITKKVLGPPYALSNPNAADYRLKIVPEKFSALSILLFGADSSYAQATTSPIPVSPSP